MSNVSREGKVKTMRTTILSRLGARISVPRMVTLIGFAVITACNSAPTRAGPEARVQVLLTDFPLEAIASAEVFISRIYLTGGGGDGYVDLFNDQVSPHVIELLELQNGVTFDLTGEVPIPEGSYSQLRFEVDVANIALEEGYTFSDDSSEKSLKVPSGFFRVILPGEEDEGDDSGSLVFQGGETEVVLVDFDVSHSFVFQGPPDSPNGVHFKPVLKQMPSL